ncbi:MAG: glycosyltransferase family 2 protein [Chloroflexi bacterium]|nr:glycosyltransferase family 2 protein [Chloroflexota bacterium]
MTISAIMVVYNEEKRIEATLRSIAWCDEIIIIDKQSTDHTLEIAQQYTNKIIQVPWRDFKPDEAQIALYSATSDWVFSATASDVVHPVLAAQIRELIQATNFPYDVIHVPYRRYVLGLETNRSPWYSEQHPVVFRKQVVRINQNSVHGAVSFSTERHFKMPDSEEYCMYHLTHETMEIMMDRHTRYLKAEAVLFPQRSPLRKAFKPIFQSIIHLVVRRRTWLMGWDGVALAMAYISYSLLRFVYIWERRRSHAPQKYQNIRESILEEWTLSEAAKHD